MIEAAANGGGWVSRTMVHHTLTVVVSSTVSGVGSFLGNMYFVDEGFGGGALSLYPSTRQHPSETVLFMHIAFAKHLHMRVLPFSLCFP